MGVCFACWSVQCIFVQVILLGLSEDLLDVTSGTPTCRLGVAELKGSIVGTVGPVWRRQVLGN